MWKCRALTTLTRGAHKLKQSYCNPAKVKLTLGTAIFFGGRAERGNGFMHSSWIVTVNLLKFLLNAQTLNICYCSELSFLLILGKL